MDTRNMERKGSPASPPADDDDRAPRSARKVYDSLPVERIVGRRTGGPKLLLAGAFGWPMPAEETAMWNAMSAEQRETAAVRLRVLLSFDGPRKAPTAEEAAAATGLSSNRWYEMFSAWREKRSLSSLGIFAAVPRSRTMAHHEDLQRLVVGVVDAEPTGSVRRLALALGEAYGRDTGTPESDWPSYNTMRKFVETELRRRSTEEKPGNDVAFDCCACELPHADGVFIGFLVLDRGSGLVLGASLGDAGDSRGGYALAARDALDRIGRAPLDTLPWAEKLERSELVIGLDEEAWADHAATMAAAGMREQLQPATKAKRFGAYVRPLIGARMGRVKFVPGRTKKEEAGSTPSKDDLVRFGVEVDAHNADLIGSPAAERTEPPALLVTLLKRLSKK